MRSLDPWSPTDPLGEALHSLKMNGAFYCRSELTAPWGLAMPPMPGYLWFHVVVSGRVLLKTGEAEETLLHPGDFALVPHGEGHLLQSDPTAPTPAILDLDRERVSERYEILRHGGGGAPTGLICGAVRFDQPSGHKLVDLLPATIVIGASQSHQTEWMQSTLRLMAAEARELRPGGETVVTRLADILVVQAIRVWIESDPAARLGWLGALRDKQIGRSIALMHREPARPWTVEALAGEAAMSRSAFSARFTEMVGEPALQYLTRWRMHLGQAALADGATIAEVAPRLGYQSEAAFARAFKRVMGMAPGAARRSSRSPAAAGL